MWENTCRAAATAAVSYRWSPESGSPGFPETWQQRRKQNTGVRSLKAQNKLSPDCYITRARGWENKVRRKSHKCQGLCAQWETKAARVHPWKMLKGDYFSLILNREVNNMKVNISKGSQQLQCTVKNTHSLSRNLWTISIWRFVGLIQKRFSFFRFKPVGRKGLYHRVDTIIQHAVMSPLCGVILGGRGYCFRLL